MYPTRLLLAWALAVALVGCSGELDPRVTQVQQYAKLACGYLPTASSVAQMILVASSPSAEFTTVTGIANAICAAVNQLPPQSLYGIQAPCPKVNGICVEGTK